MAQQTAVNWIRKKLEETYDKEGKLPLAYTFSLLNKAEQMEKEQQFRFFIAGQLSMEEGGKDFEQYYNETYDRTTDTE